MSTQHAKRADLLAERIRLNVEGVTVERASYPRSTHDVAREYVKVQLPDGSRTDAQFNDMLPRGNASGYGGPGGELLLNLIRPILDGLQREWR